MNRARRALLAALFVFSCLAATPAYAAGRAECLSLRSSILGQSVKYCVLVPPSYDTEKTRRYPVLYFLHGLGDSEQMFLHSNGLNIPEDLWEQHRVGEYLIATPAGDATFYINSRDGRTRYEDFLVQEFLPYIEHRYRTRPGRAFRGIGGISMGGYGALHLAFRHPGLFSAVSAHSPALIDKLPAGSLAESQHTGRLRLLGQVFGSPPDPAFWDRNNPITLARTANLHGLKIYFDCGADDDYSFDLGAEELHNVLLARHIAHEFHLDSGGHDWAYFANHLPASLGFHSRAFGLSAKS